MFMCVTMCMLPKHLNDINLDQFAFIKRNVPPNVNCKYCGQDLSFFTHGVARVVRYLYKKMKLIIVDDLMYCVCC